MMPVVANTSPVIDSIPSTKYQLRRPIPVVIEFDSYGEVIASVADIGIAMSGDTQSQAIKSLAEQISAVFTRYKKEASLGPLAMKQLRALETYIGDRGKPA